MLILESMSFTKKVKDQLIKALLGKSAAPQGLVEFFRYARNNGSINFKFEQDGDGWVARSTNYRWGLIITTARTREGLDEKIKDAIMTSFEIPSSYAKEANIQKVGSESREYAPA